MKKVLTNIREFFWPLLEKPHEGKSVPSGENTKTDGNDSNNKDSSDDVANNSTPYYEIIEIEDDNMEEAFKLILRIADSEEDRRKGIESKAALFISTISIATSIVVAANTLITGNQKINLPIIVSVFISFFLSLYAVRTVWFSIKALERKSFYSLDFNHVNLKGTKPEYHKKMISAFQEMTTKNYDTINGKVDYFTMAQEYYKRAIVVICIYSFLVLMFCLFYKKPAESKPAEVYIMMDGSVSLLKEKEDTDSVVPENKGQKKLDTIHIKIDSMKINSSK